MPLIERYKGKDPITAHEERAGEWIAEGIYKDPRDGRETPATAFSATEKEARARRERPWEH